MRMLLILSVLVTSACSSTTVIHASDPDAKIYVNGEYLGRGRAVYTDRKVTFSNNKVEIRKEGCQTDSYSFRRNEDADLGAIIGGIFLTIPYLWVTEYKPQRGYDYECEPVAVYLIE